MISLYKTELINSEIRGIDMDSHTIRGEVEMLKSEVAQKKKFAMTGGSLEMEFLGNGFSSDIEEEGENGVERVVWSQELAVPAEPLQTLHFSNNGDVVGRNNSLPVHCVLVNEALVELPQFFGFVDDHIQALFHVFRTSEALIDFILDNDVDLGLEVVKELCIVT